MAISRHNGTVNIETRSGSILGASAKTDRLTYAEVRGNALLWAAATDVLRQRDDLRAAAEAALETIAGGSYHNAPSADLLRIAIANAKQAEAGPSGTD